MNQKAPGSSPEFFIRRDELNELKPYQDGDFLLLADAAHWFLNAGDFGRKRWEIGEREYTEDCLVHGLSPMHLNPVQLAAMNRLMRMALDAIETAQQWQEKIAAAAVKEESYG